MYWASFGPVRVAPGLVACSSERGHRGRPLDAVAGVDAESAMMPLSHLFRFLGGEFPLFREELEHAGAKQFGDLFPISSMQGVEGARANEGAVGNEDVQMGVVVQIVAEGLYGDDHTRLSGGVPSRIRMTSRRLSQAAW